MKSLIFFALLLGLSASTLQAQDIQGPLQRTADNLSQKVTTKGKSRVVIASFLDLGNQETQLGRYMSDIFMVSLMNVGTPLNIIDRSQLARLLQDNKLAADRILDPKTIPLLGRITAAEVIITGNYAPLDNSINFTVKAIDLERGVILAASTGSVPRTAEINKLLEAVATIDSPTPGVLTDTPATPPSANVPKPAADCATKFTCIICATNKSAVNVKANIHNGLSYYIHPNETKCWQNISVNSNTGYSDRGIRYMNDAGVFIRDDDFVVEACKVYVRTLTK